MAMTWGHTVSNCQSVAGRVPHLTQLPEMFFLLGWRSFWGPWHVVLETLEDRLKIPINLFILMDVYPKQDKQVWINRRGCWLQNRRITHARLVLCLDLNFGCRVQPSFGSLSEAPVPSLFDTFKKDIKDASKCIQLRSSAFSQKYRVCWLSLGTFSPSFKPILIQSLHNFAIAHHKPACCVLER